MDFTNPQSARERQNVAQPFINRRRYIDLTSYLPSSDIEDCWAGTQAAFNDAQNREVVVTMGYNQTRRFRFRYVTNGRLILPHTSKIIWEPGAVFDFSAYGRTREASQGITYMHREAARLQTINIPTNVPSGANWINLATPPAGDPATRMGYALLQSTDLFTPSEGTLGTRSEWVYVVRSTDTRLTFAGKVLDNYLAAAGSITLTWFNMPKLHLENIQVIGAGKLNDVGGVPKLGDRAIRIYHAKDTIIDGADIQYCDFSGLDFVSCPRGSVRNASVVFDDLPGQDRNQYGICHNSTCEDWVVKDSQVFGGKEAFVLSSTGGDGAGYYSKGITRRIKYTGNLAKGAWRSGYCTHHNHESIEWINNIAEDCELGIDMRIGKATARGNIFRRMGNGSGSLDCGVLLSGNTRNIHLSDNYYEDCLRGIFMTENVAHATAPGDYVFHNETMRGERMIYGVDISFGPSAAVPVDTQLGTINIQGLDTEGRTLAGSAPAGVRLRGKWTNPKVQGRIQGGTGAGAAVNMSRGSTSVSDTGGPINPMVDIEYSSGFAAPVIQHATGLTKMKLSGIGFLAPGE